MTRSARGSTAPRGTWLELAVEADIEAVEAVSEILSRVASGGTSVEPAFEAIEDGLAARLDATKPAIVRGYVPIAAGGRVAADEAVAAVEVALGHLTAFGLRPIGELRTREVREADWATAWKRHFAVLRVGRRLVIRPTWRRLRARRDDVVVTLDPGMAFGTGLHPTTRLCLVALERVVDLGEVPTRVLDVGCGSGILSIAAARLGAAAVLGVDIDPIAVEATQANVRRNRLSRRVRARLGSLPSRQPPFDLVLANLVAGVVVELADALIAELRPGGRLIASGIFVDREPDVIAALEGRGLKVEARDAEGDWVALTAIRAV